jgi:pimeloyl-ACP methyl ester carboxylesterase
MLFAPDLKINMGLRQFLLITILLFNEFCFSQNSKINYGNNAAAGKYAAINGIKLYYETYGKGSPLLMLHGNGGSIEAFSNQIPFFEKYFKVIAIDSRLQGKSGGSADTLSYDMMADDFCSLIDYLHLDSVYVLGWSDGGNNGLIMAMHCSDKIKCLAITGANVVPDSTAIPASDIEEMKNFVMYNKTASKKDITLNRMMLYQPNIPFRELGKIKCPVLVMAGDHDIIKLEHILKIYQAIPKANLCIFPDSNHGVCQQHPDMFNKMVIDFFRRNK